MPSIRDPTRKAVVGFLVITYNWVRFFRRFGQGWVLEGLAKPAVLWSPGPLVPWSLVPWSSGSLVSGPVISGPAVLWFLDLLIPWSLVHRFWFIGSVFSAVPWSVVSGPWVRGSLVTSGLLFAVGVEVLKGGCIFSILFVCPFIFCWRGSLRRQGRKECREKGRKEGEKRKQQRKEER